MRHFSQTENSMNFNIFCKTFLIVKYVFQALLQPPPNVNHCNGHINMVDFNINDKKSAIDASNDLTRRIAGKNLLTLVE